MYLVYLKILTYFKLTNDYKDYIYITENSETLFFFINLYYNFDYGLKSCLT